MRRRTSEVARVVFIVMFAAGCAGVDSSNSGTGTGHSVAAETASTVLAVNSAGPTVTTIVELGDACSRTAREPINTLRDRQQLHRLAVSDTFDIVACYAAVDMLNRSDWTPSFDIDPALCPGKRPTYAAAETVQQVIDIAWVSDVLASPYDLPVGVATSTATNSAGGLRSLAVIVFCR